MSRSCLTRAQSGRWESWKIDGIKEHARALATEYAALSPTTETTPTMSSERKPNRLTLTITGPSKEAVAALRTLSVRPEVLEVIFQMARELLARRDELVRGGWAMYDMPFEAEVRAALSPTTETTE